MLANQDGVDDEQCFVYMHQSITPTRQDIQPGWRTPINKHFYFKLITILILCKQLQWVQNKAAREGVVHCYIYKKVKNIKNVRRCRDGMPKSMQTR